MTSVHDDAIAYVRAVFVWADARDSRELARSECRLRDASVSVNGIERIRNHRSIEHDLRWLQAMCHQFVCAGTAKHARPPIEIVIDSAAMLV